MKTNKLLLILLMLMAAAALFNGCFVETCSDGILNQDEIGIDCGGDCPACETCFDGIWNQGETGTDCGGPCFPCSTATCFDGIQNQGETGIDCGGPCSPCGTATCFDGIQNQGETGIDCGGPCSPCGTATCFDGIQNQGETGIDCGGPCLPCATATCSDGIQNQGETGIDCGGPCPPCFDACSGLTSVTDIDGNVYAVVSIGSQCWTAANMKTTTYNNGSPIPFITDSWDWWHLSTGAYCHYDHNPGNSATYGKMYNWYAVNTGNLCPTGWHVPSEAEWATLETYLGEWSLSGGKLKETGTAHWQSPNTAATNETGFTALPGGYCSSTGSFFNITWNGYWWTATEGSDPAYGVYRFLDFNLGGIFNNEDYKVDGLSCRCIRD